MLHCEISQSFVCRSRAFIEEIKEKEIFSYHWIGFLITFSIFITIVAKNSKVFYLERTEKIQNIE